MLNAKLNAASEAAAAAAGGNPLFRTGNDIWQQECILNDMSTA